jgi:hypothetical protein
MIIQINTNKTIQGNERFQDFFSTQITKELVHFQSHITRVEAHLSDENGNKAGTKDIRCVLEARLEGRKPMAVSNQAATIELAVSGAITKLKSSLTTILGRLKNHEN